MGKKDENTTRSGGVDHHENPENYGDQYSELLEVPVKYLKAVERKVVVDNYVELEEIKFVKGMEKFRVSESDELDQEKLKAVETLKARLFNLYDELNPEGILFFCFLWMTTMKTESEGIEKCQHYLIPSLHSTEKLFDEDIDISVLADLADTQLENIKAYNSKKLALLEAENLNEVTLQEMSNHYSSFYKGIRSLNMKIDILRFHLTHRRRDLKTLGDLKTSVDRFSASLEGELRQYEEELETTRFKVFQLGKNQKTNLFGLRWLPDSWKGTFFSNGMKPFILGARLMHWIQGYSTLHNINEKEKTLSACLIS